MGIDLSLIRFHEYKKPKDIDVKPINNTFVLISENKSRLAKPTKIELKYAGLYDIKFAEIGFLLDFAKSLLSSSASSMSFIIKAKAKLNRFAATIINAFEILILEVLAAKDIPITETKMQLPKYSFQRVRLVSAYISCCSIHIYHS